MILGTPGGDKPLSQIARPENPYSAFSSLSRDSFTGRDVTPEGSLALTAVFGAVSLIANTAGTLPLEIIEEANGSRRVIRDHPLARLLRYQPNEDMSASVLWTLVFNHLLLRGNAYLAKLTDKSGRVSELVPLNPQFVNPFRGEGGQKLFYVNSWDGQESSRVVLDTSQVIHIMGPSFDNGVRGASPIAVARNRMGVQLAQSEYQARFYQQGYQLKGVLSTENASLTKEAADRIKQQWRGAYSGLDNAHDIAILHSGVKFQPVSITPEDAQFIETMKYGATEVATLFNLPASRLNAEGASLTYANSAQDDLHFMKGAVLPRLCFVEDALNIDKTLFGGGKGSYWYPKFNVEGALRADLKTRFEAYDIALRGDNPWMTVDEVRQIESLPAQNKVSKGTPDA